MKYVPSVISSCISLDDFQQMSYEEEMTIYISRSADQFLKFLLRIGFGVGASRCPAQNIVLRSRKYCDFN